MENHPENTKKEKNDSQGRSGLNDYFKYAGLGFQMLAIIGIFTWVGVKLDERSASESSIYTAILALLGVIIGIYIGLKDFIQRKK
ncbi:MAG: AtpZ/AtpI family protein [Bacteroidales bacterium]|nr:AtpZ/AtpI family protein [Bacteroidales bacterium]MDT8430353.1 AtpZ/AtpI family protein [Bacteroidales bacterium]